MLSDDNILEAIRTVNKGHRMSHGRPNKTVVWVEETLDDRIVELREIVENGFVSSPTRDFTTFDATAGKTREIHEPKLWPDQYVHHMLIQVITPVMMRGMDYWCCGSIPGRGTSHGIRGIEKWMKRDLSKFAVQRDYEYFLGVRNTGYISDTQYAAELDIHHFYNSLTQEVVVDRMRQLIKDEKIIDLIKRVTNDGILIGAYPSQWFANTVLQPLDHLIREKLKVKHYVRYMDNLTLFSSNRRVLFKAVRAIQKWLGERGLQLKSNWSIFSTTLSQKAKKTRDYFSGKAYFRRHPRLVNAMGYMFGHGYTLMRKKNLIRLKRQLRRAYKKIRQGKPIPYQMAAGLLSRLGMLKHCNSYHIQKRYVEWWLIPMLKDAVREETKRRRLKAA